jgi:HK97 family phage major capsid protein
MTDNTFIEAVKGLEKAVETGNLATAKSISDFMATQEKKANDLASDLAAERKAREESESETKARLAALLRPNSNGNSEESSEAKEFSLVTSVFNKKDNVSQEEISSYKNVFEKLLRKSMNLNFLEANEVKALQVGNDNEGGFLVRPQMANTIIQKSFETSPIRELATKVNISSDSYEQIVDFDDFEASYIAELATKNTTANTTFSKVRIEAEEIYAKPLISNKMLEDSSINIEQYVIGKLGNKFARKEATSYISGNGVGQAKGLLSYADGTVYGKVEQVETKDSLVISSDDLLNIAGKLKAVYHQNAVFLMSRVTFFSKVLTMKTGNGEYIIESFRDPKEGKIVYSILGYPVIFCDDMIQASVGTAFTAGQLPIMFGDIKTSYTIVDRIGISILRDPYTQDGAVKLSARKRSGGGAVNTESYKILKIKA